MENTKFDIVMNGNEYSYQCADEHPKIIVKNNDEIVYEQSIVCKSRKDFEIECCYISEYLKSV
jgi:hypothetical protein